MTNKELIGILKDFPEDDKVDFMVFTRLMMKRCDILDSDVMIRRNKHNSRTCIMLNLSKYSESDITTEIAGKIVKQAESGIGKWIYNRHA